MLEWITCIATVGCFLMLTIIAYEIALIIKRKESVKEDK